MVTGGKEIMATPEKQLEQALDQTVFLDPDQKSPRAQDFEDRLEGRIVGQERAVRRMAGLYQIFLAGMNPINRPIGTMLFLGPTGSGKTRVIEAAAEVLFADTNAIVKIDCAEFQHSHEIAKLIGSPPGYLGHRETSPMLTQENLDRMHTDDLKLTLVLFDEIEKAHQDVFNVLLQILDDGRLTDSKGRTVDFKNTVLIMTSNLGSREIQAAEGDEEQVRDAVLEELREHFKPEFLNRIDDIIVFHQLGEEEIVKIIDVQLERLKQMLHDRNITLVLDDSARRLLAREGYDPAYGARPLKRAIQTLIQNPMAVKLLNGEILPGQTLNVSAAGNQMKFQTVMAAGA